ncbi:hypothetical protein [Streptomyces sp. NPDC059262]|uniref:hypothetical protein n=1 Tax=Streptomyces sp. NPDC059262 TaxID=3346797 RepID=UPI0036B9F88F
MEGNEADRQLLRYGKEITLADVERAESFLMDRTARLARAERGSDERQMARSVRTALLQLVVTLQHSLPSSDSADESQALVHSKISVSWNALWALLSPWQWHSEYDQERWRSVKHWDKDKEVEFNRRLSDEFPKSQLHGNSENESE